MPKLDLHKQSEIAFLMPLNSMQKQIKIKNPLGLTVNTTKIKRKLNPLTPQDFISNSPYYLPYSSCDVSFENLVLDQLIIL